MPSSGRRVMNSIVQEIVNLHAQLAQVYRNELAKWEECMEIKKREIWRQRPFNVLNCQYQVALLRQAETKLHLIRNQFYKFVDMTFAYQREPTPEKREEIKDQSKCVLEMFGDFSTGMDQVAAGGCPPAMGRGR